MVNQEGDPIISGTPSNGGGPIKLKKANKGGGFYNIRDNVINKGGGLHYF